MLIRPATRRRDLRSYGNASQEAATDGRDEGPAEKERTRQRGGSAWLRCPKYACSSRCGRLLSLVGASRKGTATTRVRELFRPRDRGAVPIHSHADALLPRYGGSTSPAPASSGGFDILIGVGIDRFATCLASCGAAALVPIRRNTLPLLFPPARMP